MSTHTSYKETISRKIYQYRTAILIAVIVMVFSYVALWHAIAYKIQNTIITQANKLQDYKLDIKYSDIKVGGFPTKFTITASDIEMLNNQQHSKIPKVKVTLNPLLTKARIELPKEVVFSNLKQNTFDTYQLATDSNVRIAFTKSLAIPKRGQNSARIKNCDVPKIHYNINSSTNPRSTLDLKINYTTAQNIRNDPYNKITLSINAQDSTAQTNNLKSEVGVRWCNGCNKHRQEIIIDNIIAQRAECTIHAQGKIYKNSNQTDFAPYGEATLKISNIDNAISTITQSQQNFAQSNIVSTVIASIPPESIKNALISSANHTDGTNLEIKYTRSPGSKTFIGKTAAEDFFNNLISTK